MLKLIKKSSNKKLGGCAATYRSGNVSVYGTCPSSCVLKPESEPGSLEVDTEYLNEVLHAVPRSGVAWTYTHFAKEQIPKPEIGKTCINISCDSVDQALSSFSSGYPTVVVRPSTQTEKVDRISNIRIVRCPAEYSDITCDTCGGDTPLCARSDRDYIIKFTAHGSSKKVIDIRQDQPEKKGGCYGNSGPVRLQWENTKKSAPTSDVISLREFVAALPPGTKLRHHVVGDLGA